MTDSPYIVEVTTDSFAEVLQASFQVPVLMDFWADWCQPCHVLMPILAKLAEDYRGKFILAKLNTEENREIAAQFGIRSIPTVKLFKDGQIVDEFMGALPEQGVRQFLDRHIVDEEQLAEALALKLQVFADEIENAPDTDELEARLAADDSDHQARYLLAMRKVTAGDVDTALELLLQLMQKDRGFEDDAGRRALIKVFELLGDDPRVSRYRRRMTSLLY